MKLSYKTLFSKHRSKIFDRAMDLAIVIFGISIAFFIEQKGKFVDQKQEQVRYLKALSLDLNKDIRELSETQIPFNQFKNTEIKTVLKNVQKDRIIHDSIQLKLRRTFVSLNAIINDDTYESIKQSGKFNIIGDLSIVKPIVSYYKHSEKLKEIKSMNLEHLNRLTDYCSQKGKFTMTKDKYGLITVDFSSNLIRDFQFVNLLNKWQILIDFKVSEYKKVKDQAVTLAALIDSELNSLN